VNNMANKIKNNDTHAKKKDDVKKKDAKIANINPVAAGVTGAVIGAGVGVVASNALKNEKTQEKVHQVISSAKGQALDYIDSMSKQAPMMAGGKGGKSSSKSKGHKKQKNSEIPSSSNGQSM